MELGCPHTRADMRTLGAPGRPRGQTGRMWLKNGLRGAWAGPEAKRANFAIDLASGGAGPAQRPKWPSGLRGCRAGREAKMADLASKMASGWPPGAPGRSRGQNGRFRLKSGLWGRRARPEAKMADFASNLASWAQMPAGEAKMGKHGPVWAKMPAGRPKISKNALWKARKGRK